MADSGYPADLVYEATVAASFANSSEGKVLRRTGALIEEFNFGRA